MITMVEHALIWSQLLCLLFIGLHKVLARENGLFEINRYCVSTTPTLSIGCPHQHMIVATSTGYYRSKQPGCNLQSTDSCQVKSVSQETFKKCYGLAVCTLHLQEPTVTNRNCSSHQGNTFLEIKYKCEPILNTARGQLKKMCTNFTFTGSLIYMTNSDFPSPSRDDQCSCSVSVINGTYLEFDTLTFEDTVQKHDPVTECPQKLNIWTDNNGGELYEVCSHEAEDPKAPLDIHTDTKAIINLDNIADRLLSLVFIVQVYHESDLTITCSDKSTTLPAVPEKPTSNNDASLPSSTSSPTTTSTTSTPLLPMASSSSSSSSGSTSTSTATLYKPTSTVAVHSSTATLSPDADVSDALPNNNDDPSMGRATKLADQGGISSAIVVSIVVVLLVVIILLIIGLLYMRHIRKKEKSETGKKQTDRFTFENITYNIPNGNVANGTIATGDNEHSLGNGVVGKNNNLPYNSPLDGAHGRERKNSIVFKNGSVQNTGEKIHIFDHHENRPVSWPPRPPPGVRLSFRESKTDKNKEDPHYEELPDALPSGIKDHKVAISGHKENVNNNSSNSNEQNNCQGNKENGISFQTPVTVELPPKTESLKPLQRSKEFDPRQTDTLNKGLDEQVTSKSSKSKS